MALVKVSKFNGATKAPTPKDKALEELAKQRINKPKQVIAAAPTDEALDPYALMDKSEPDDLMQKAKEVAQSRAKAKMGNTIAPKQAVDMPIAKAPASSFVAPESRAAKEAKKYDLENAYKVERPMVSRLASTKAPEEEQLMQIASKRVASGKDMPEEAMARGRPITAPAKADNSPPSEDELLSQIYDSIKGSADSAELSKQKAILDSRSRSGLSGAGIAGSQALAEGDLAVQMDTKSRDAILNQAADLLDLQRSDKAFKLKEQELEAILDKDLDDDGKVAGEKLGGKVGDNDPDNNDKQALEQKINDLLADMDQGFMGDGSYKPNKSQVEKLKRAGAELKETGETFQGLKEYEDQYGNRYWIEPKEAESFGEFVGRFFSGDPSKSGD